MKRIHFMKHLEKRISFLDEKEKEIYQAKKYTEKALANLEQRILSLLDNVENNEIKGELYSFKHRKSSGKVIIENEDLVPPCYKILKTTESLDKKEILKDLKLGLEVEGARLSYEPTLSKSVVK